MFQGKKVGEERNKHKLLKITCSGTKQGLLYGRVPLEGTGMQHLPSQHQSNSGHMSYQQASSSTPLCWGETGEGMMFVNNHWDLWFLSRGNKI